jgi:hypothetical protein
LEEGNVETQAEHMLKTVVYVNTTVCVLLRFRGSVTGERKKNDVILQEILGPFEGICVELVGVR